MQRHLRLLRENALYYKRSDLPDPDKEVEFVIQPRRKKDADA